MMNESTFKKCSGCKAVKSLDEFTLDPNGVSGRHGYCKPCKSLAAKLSRKRNQERNRILYLEKRQDPVRVEKQREASRRHVRRIRLETIKAYGGGCACCGEKTYEFLAVDHINGEGNKQRKGLGKSGVNFYSWLKKQGFPKDEYRLLCHNCNMAKGFYGECPHRKTMSTAA